MLTYGDFCFFFQKMSSLVERLRVRSDRRPVYNIDESDDDADFLPGKPGTNQEKFERIVRSDAVCFFYLLFYSFFFFGNLLLDFSSTVCFFFL
jgi:hypothetical protein